MQDLSERIDTEIRRYVESRSHAEDMEDRAKQARKEADDQRDRLWDIMEAAGIKTFTHESLGRLTRMVRQKALVTDDDSLSAYLHEEGIFDAMTKRAWRAANLNALVGEMIENGDPLPPGLDSLAIKGIRYTPKR